ncbi:MAG TPA: homocysteine S-methyltransferase family protein, partial [bacterium]|nr:homocysteine S-methyltransferase family protein [bacterium]
SEHGLEGRVREINAAAAKAAREASDAASSAKKPRFVAGDVGPGSKLPTLGHIGFDELFEAYLEQMKALIEGGVDCILVETCQDPLGVKAALAAAAEAGRESGRDVPAIASMTVERTGTMLLGTELSAALASAAPYAPAAFGINCAVGPQAMEEHVQFLSSSSPFPIIVQPNAGIPENVGGKPVYPLVPEEFAEVLGGFVSRLNVALAGGCCGTTPDHIRALAKRIGASAERGKARGGKIKWSPSVSGLYTAQRLDQEPRPFIVAEQTNVNGSKKFREMLLADDFDAMAEVAQKAAASAHALDVCLAFAGRDERSDFRELLRRVVLKADAAIMVDSTDPAAMEAALSLIPGRPIINSINLEDGGAKARRVLSLARRFGAAVVALTIDEEGMAREAKRKLSIARRLLRLAEEEGLNVQDLLFDALTFTLASGDPKLRDSARETLKAVRAIKEEIPGARTILGVSNVSFGLPLPGRRALTSLFLHRAVEAGLDAAIINPSRILPVDAIPEEEALLCAKLIDADFTSGDPLSELIRYVDKVSLDEEPTLAIHEELSPDEELRLRVLKGNASNLSEPVRRALEAREANSVLNDVLLPAMQEVGRRFGEGKLALPFVLQSAEAMRAAIDLLTPHLKSGECGEKGTIVLATVRGDVHDIGKNLVDAILSNNGFKVVNLGIRQSASAIAEAVAAHGADAVGLSGLLVSSTEVMREDLALFKEMGLGIPVLCGGAALTRAFAEGALAGAYGGRVYYCADAFAGLLAMEEIAKGKRGGGAGKGWR